MGFADDYISVNARLEQFLTRYPDGRIQTEIAKHTDAIVIMRATVYRDVDDVRPTIAHSQLGIPGKTNFTRDSEVENAETSAVGRALAFMGFETKKSIASREEVLSRQVEPQAPVQRPTPKVGEIVEKSIPPTSPPPAETAPQHNASVADVTQHDLDVWKAFTACFLSQHLTAAQVKATLGGFSAAALSAWMTANNESDPVAVVMHIKNGEVNA